MQQKNIHWFPGHMVKAMRQIEERLKVIDIIIEIVDSRAPISSKNPFLEKITQNKKRLLVFSKKDLCDEDKISEYLNFYNAQNYSTVLCDLNNKNDIKKLIDKAFELGKDRQEKYIKRGMKPQPLRVMILGIPNVGKSTLINRLCKRNAASSRNTPGHTKAQQWVRINNSFELLDTPGILPPHYEDENISLRLAWIGSIKENILPLDDIYTKLILFLVSNYKEELVNRYSLKGPLDDVAVISEEIGKNRNLLLKGGIVDYDAVSKLVLREFKDGLITKVVVDELC